MIGRLRKALFSALGRRGGGSATSEPGTDGEAARRIEAARRRLKQSIPPRAD